MPSLFKRSRPDEAVEDKAPTPSRRRYLPPPGRLRRERRELLRYREERIHDLGGLMLEMYRRDDFRQDIVDAQAAEIVALEERVREVDRLLAARSSQSNGPRCAGCGTPLHAGARFCSTCGRSLEARAET